MNTKMMNGHEKIAAKNIEGAFNWLVGGWYNCLQDGYEEDIPSLEEAKETVYAGTDTHPRKTAGSRFRRQAHRACRLR